LSLSGPLAIKSRFELEIGAEDIEQPIVKTAEVCWGRPVNDLEWWIGCAFEEELSEENMSHLASFGCLERRRDSRTLTEIPAKARCELASDTVDVTLADYSAGGFSIRSPEPLASRDRILLQLEGFEDETPTVGKVRWQTDNESHWSIGCGFVNKNGYRVLLSQISPGLTRKTFLHVPIIEVVTAQTWIAVTSGLIAAALLTMLILYR